MATYNTAFGALPGYNEMLGTTNTTGGGQQPTYGGTPSSTTRPPSATQTFAQMQQQGIARPPAPQAQAFAQYGGSQQGAQMRQRLQEQLAQFGQAPSRFDTQAFQQIRGAQAANLQAEYQGQQKALSEDLARRGLSASSIGAGRMGDLAGQQARALSTLDAQLLQQAAETQAQDRAQLLAAGQGLAELAGSQDLAQFEANRVAQAATFENQLRAAQFGQQQYETEQGYGLRFGELTGELGGMQTLAGQQQAEQRRQFDIQQALQSQLGLGGLGIQQQELALKQQSLQQQAADATAERALREKLQTTELTAQEQQQLREITSRQQLQTQQITEQARQFGLTLNEQQAQRLQQGGFTAQELALESQKIGNQVNQFGQTLSAQERQNQALNNLEQQKLTDDRTFRSQQLGLNSRELDLRATQIQQEFQQRGQQITNDQAYRQAELSLRTTQVQNEYAIAGRQIGVDEARIIAQKDISTADNAAQMSRLTSQLASQEKVATMETALRRQLGMMEATGNIYNVGADGTVTQGAGSTLARLQQNLQQAQILSQITGKQYTVDNAGNIVQGGTQTETARQFDLDQRLRGALGLSEASGFVYNPFTGQLERTAAGAPQETVQGQIARSQILLSLAQSLGTLTQDQIASLFGKAPATSSTSTTPPAGADTSTPASGTAAGSPPSGGASFPVGNSFTDKYGYVWTKTTTGWVLKSSPSTSSTSTTSTTSTDELSKAPTGATEGAVWTSASGKKYVFTNGQWVLQTSTSTTTTNADFYKTAATGANVPTDALTQLSGVTNPSPTGVYMSYGKYYQNAGSGWYEVAIINGQWTRVT